jgi:hypothetical protein
MVAAVMITPTILEAPPAVRYNDVTAAYIINEAATLPIDSETNSRLRLLKL